MEYTYIFNISCTIGGESIHQNEYHSPISLHSPTLGLCCSDWYPIVASSSRYPTKHMAQSFFHWLSLKFQSKKQRLNFKFLSAYLKHMKPFCSLDLWMKDDERMKEYLDSFTPEIVFFCDDRKSLNLHSIAKEHLISYNHPKMFLHQKNVR